MSSRKAELLMASVSLAWGSSYLLMKVGLEGIGPFNLITLRFGIAFLAMFLIFFRKFSEMTVKTFGKGCLMGFLLFIIFSGFFFLSFFWFLPFPNPLKAQKGKKLCIIQTRAESEKSALPLK